MEKLNASITLNNNTVLHFNKEDCHQIKSYYGETIYYRIKRAVENPTPGLEDHKRIHENITIHTISIAFVSGFDGEFNIEDLERRQNENK